MCEEVRELLPEHLLGALPDTQDAAIRRHLRGCAECRDERVRLEDGVAALSYAADQAPPDDLRERVLDVLGNEWDAPEQDAESASASAARWTGSAWRWLAVAAVAILVAVSLGYGVNQAHRAETLAADASSYQSLLATLGGKEFRLGTLHSADGEAGMGGTVVLYDGIPGSDWNSWGIVLVHAPNYDGQARAMLLGDDGKTLELPALRFENGEASTWVVTHDDLAGYDRLVITSQDGSVLANASITDA